MKKTKIVKLKNSRGIYSKYAKCLEIDCFYKNFYIFKKVNNTSFKPCEIIRPFLNYVDNYKSYPFGNIFIIGYYDEYGNFIYGKNVKEYIDNIILISKLEGSLKLEEQNIKSYRYGIV